MHTGTRRNPSTSRWDDCICWTHLRQGGAAALGLMHSEHQCPALIYCCSTVATSWAAGTWDESDYVCSEWDMSSEDVSSIK